MIWLVLNIALTYAMTHKAYFLREIQKGMPTRFPYFFSPQKILPIAARFIFIKGCLILPMVTVALVNSISKGPLQVSKEKLNA